MKHIVKDFILRGLVAGSFGPIVLAILYLILQKKGVLDTLTIHQVCTGIFSITALAFIAGGMNAIYQIERLPLMLAIFIHGAVLYVSYLGTYLLNDWLKPGAFPLLAFTVIFLVSYVIIWVIIYTVTKKRAGKLNMILKQKQERNV